MESNAHVYPEGCFFKSIEDIKDKHITVMGLGLNGGGEACVRFLLKHGAYVIATDMKNEQQLKPTIDSIASDKNLDTSRLTYVLGEHKIEDFENADCVIKNPGVKIQGNKFLSAAKRIETDISIFLALTKSPIIAITGSKGKSSTVSAIHYGLNEAGIKTFLGGNITVSPLTFLEETTEQTPVVLELSSWQLADLRGRKLLKPHIALITKIVPDHQNWYGNMRDYVADKSLIYADQDENDFTIIDADKDAAGTGPATGGTWGNIFAHETKAKVLRYSQNNLDPLNKKNVEGVWQTFDDDNNFSGVAKIPSWIKPQTVLTKLKVPGVHQRQNVLNAALVMALMGVDAEKTASILSNWTGIPHRLQFFHTWQCNNTTYKFFNDSCSTVPEAAAAASQSFGKPIVFITGGTDKGLEFDILAHTLDTQNSNATPVADLYLLEGTGTDKLLKKLEGTNVQYKGPYPSLDSLLGELKNNLQSNTAPRTDTIVFSPGATSFGMFTNEFDRGNQFMDKVKKGF
ncbi:MAG: UDP-N-acetylmuramoyl-L-alanine--D-glutamate ligase [Treponema sp.]|nr:UDP-N-acetylmuramoyl-L-alanine--D-glutamate ligase [Treponema sp.]